MVEGYMIVQGNEEDESGNTLKVVNLGKGHVYIGIATEDGTDLFLEEYDRVGDAKQAGVIVNNSDIKAALYAASVLDQEDRPTL